MLACVEFKSPSSLINLITAVSAACAGYMNDRVKDYALPSPNSREKGTELALAEVDITQDMVPISSPHVDGGRDRAILMVQMLKNYTAYVCKRRDLCRFDEIIRRTNENK